MSWHLTQNSLLDTDMMKQKMFQAIKQAYIMGSYMWKKMFQESKGDTELHSRIGIKSENKQNYFGFEQYV